MDGDPQSGRESGEAGLGFAVDVEDPALMYPNATIPRYESRGTGGSLSATSVAVFGGTDSPAGLVGEALFGGSLAADVVLS